MNKIIAATDFSEASLVALEAAFRLAQESGATLYLLHVLDIPLSDHPEGIFHSSIAKVKADAAKKLDSLIPANWENDSAGQIETIVLGEETSVASTIARFAQEQDADMIVVGTHGRTGLKRLLMGSTAENLLRAAPCQVLVVKQKVTEGEPTQEGAVTVQSREEERL